MTLTIKTCIAWREHVTLSCPSWDEAKDIAKALNAEDTTAANLKKNTAMWMRSMSRSMADFFDDDDMDAFMTRLIRFFYLEAMNAGQTFHQSTGSLLDCPLGSIEKQTAMCAAMLAGTFRVLFEEISYEGMASLSDVWKAFGQKEPAQPIKIDTADAASPATAEG